MSEHETVFVVEKKLGSRERTWVVAPTEDEARNWLAEQIEHDPMMGDFEFHQYKRLVCEGPDGVVYGHITEVPWIDDFEDPVVAHDMVPTV